METKKIIKLPGLEQDPQPEENLNECIPAETRLKWLLKEQGKLISYTQELEDEIKALKAEIKQLNMVSNNDKKAIQRESTYAKMREEMKKLEKTIGTLRSDNNLLISRLHNRK